MSRLSKALPLALALAALGVFSSSCSSSSPASVRFVQAIQDAGPLDINISGASATSTKQFTDIAFLGVQPNQPGYTSVPSGSDMIEGFVTGTTTVAFSDNATLSSAAQYTLIATGFSQTGMIKGSNVVLLQISDNIPAPPLADVAFRVINASPSGPSGTPGAVDVYILLNPTTAPEGNPTISSLSYTQASKYVSIPNNPNNDTTPPGFTVYVTAAGTMQPVISQPIYLPDGAVRTLVLTDIQNGTKMNSSYLELSDLN